jgi:hypothetical protein
LEGPNDGPDPDTRAPKVRVADMRRDIGSFIIRQIAAYPSISECDLQKQLALAFAIVEAGCRGLQRVDDWSPHAFAES